MSDINLRTEAFLNDLDFDDIVADAEKLKATPSNEDIKALSALVQEQYELEQEVLQIEDHLKNRKAELDKIAEVTIPEIMDRFQITEFGLANGVKLVVKPYYSGKIAGNESLEWLEENGHGGIVKGNVVVNYPKGFDKALLNAIVEAATKLKLQANIKEKVHHQTLKAWIKEMVEGGQPFPRELFNVYVGQRAKITVK